MSAPRSIDGGNATPRKRGGRRIRIALWVLLVLLIAAGAWSWWVYLQIEHYASTDQAQPSGAIAVFGAAEYDGRPSPVFRARLDHANDLFGRGLAPVVITTGGAAADPNFSEGGVGRDYLSR